MNVSYLTGSLGMTMVLQQAIHDLEGFNVTGPDHLKQLLERDMNRLDVDRDTKAMLAQLPLHFNQLGRRSGPRNYIADTLAARNADGTARFPLTLSPRSLATKVLFQAPHKSGGRPKATGVEYLYGEAMYAADRRYNSSAQGEVRTVRASREVIIAGGVFNTPQLLKLSGIGPADELKRFGINVVADLPAVVSSPVQTPTPSIFDSEH
jgi:choline dehydrogenase